MVWANSSGPGFEPYGGGPRGDGHHGNHTGSKWGGRGRGPRPCNGSAPAYFAAKFRNFQTINAVGYAITLLIAVGLVLYLRRHRSSAYSGNTAAARKVLLPSFEPLLWAVIAISGLYCLYFVFAAATDDMFAVHSPVFLQALHQGRQCLFYLIVAFLHQSSVSRRALWRALLIALLLALLPIALFLVIPETNREAIPIAEAVYLGLMLLGFLKLLLWPPLRASRSAWRQFALFAIVYFATSCAHHWLFAAAGWQAGTILVFFSTIWAAMLPYFIWRLLQADTNYWRGLGQHAAMASPHDHRRIHEIVSAQGLHVLLEVHQHDVIDFAHLELQTKIGVGATATVYKGLLESKQPVAIKVYTPREISEATIAEFSEETALCAVLKHPNIVAFYGMCVSPPTICLVSELCECSLDALLAGPQTELAEPLWPRLCYLLDAARAVAYLHSFRPPFVHRDLKPSNFLLDANHVLKLTDFGASRSMAARRNITDDDDMYAAHDDVLHTERSMTVRGTADYMAPEVIDARQGRASYSEAADIYSLAITFWDVLHPGREKYSSADNHLQVFSVVLDGDRPPLHPDLHPPLRSLLEGMWGVSPEYRPTATAVVASLENILRDMLPRIAQRLHKLLQTAAKRKASWSHVADDAVLLVSGEEIAHCLVEHGYANDIGLATRLGNSLLDAGYVHHLRHTKHFEASPATYYFDMIEIELCLTPAVGALGVTAVSAMDDDDDDAQMAVLLEKPRCMCRKLAQGHFGMTKASLFRRRRHMHAPLSHHALTVHLLNEVGEEEAVVVSRT
ncbi:TKL/SHK protein kinase [Saprolegnia parasitica CBS 223.65]|uniref:TKL/SHK protein kinase n=1 Tax=Saprolegnia parasitica (strain CBS 223.65) TaxID=695850 RepID=A0A067C7V1_SAPPC|nr:TKL/SHK protein kinase [Saprolegnia parasitica CBS 223.65]KDO26588.1 TKL/SHK protein kinase [Saprolegnia parasitica CBS 223.65]|eukprot:XP_012202730.1 TKL/SHK protein kinase [Saprolegnia parasitica CBS 223.65]